MKIFYIVIISIIVYIVYQMYDMEQVQKPRFFKPKIFINVNKKEEFYNILKDLKQKYPLDTLRLIERIYILESGNFKSQQFLNTYTPGIEAVSNRAPMYGWSTKHLKGIENANKPVGIVPMKDNHTGVNTNYVKFPTLRDGVLFTLNYFMNYGNETALKRWNANPNYPKKLLTLKTIL